MNGWESRRYRWANAMFLKLKKLLLLKGNSDQRMVSYLIRQFRRPKKIVAFRWMWENKIEGLAEDQKNRLALAMGKALPQVCEQYIRNHDGVLGYLIDQIEYFGVRSDEVNAFLLKLLRQNSTSDWIVSMRGVIFAADEKTMMEVLDYCGTQDIPCSDKLITDTLMAYLGDKVSLDEALVKAYPYYREGVQCSLINYWAQTNNSTVYRVIYLTLIDAQANMNVRIAAIKYFGKVYDDRAWQVISSLMQDEATAWEIKVNCAKSLEIYPQQATTEILMSNLSDANWYVRNNCAITLVNQDEQNMREKLPTLHDHYAKNIVEYVLRMHDKRHIA